jgi:hypothetical protein
MYEVRLVDMNIGELCDLLKLMTANRQPIRSSGISPVQAASGRPRLSLVRPE